MPIKNKKKLSEWNKNWFKKPEVKERRREYLQRPYVKKRIYEYKQTSKYKKYLQKYLKKYNQDPSIIIIRNLRIKEKRKNKDWAILMKLRIYFITSLKRYTETGKIMSSKKYGIDYQAIINHLKPFPKNIENYHVDHIIPLSRFNFNNPEHIKRAFSPDNHQWLTIQQNLEKGDRLIMPH